MYAAKLWLSSGKSSTEERTPFFFDVTSVYIKITKKPGFYFPTLKCALGMYWTANELRFYQPFTVRYAKSIQIMNLWQANVASVSELYMSVELRALCVERLFLSGRFGTKLITCKIAYLDEEFLYRCRWHNVVIHKEQKARTDRRSLFFVRFYGLLHVCHREEIIFFVYCLLPDNGSSKNRNTWQAIKYYKNLWFTVLTLWGNVKLYYNQSVMFFTLICFSVSRTCKLQLRALYVGCKIFYHRSFKNAEWNQKFW